MSKAKNADQMTLSLFEAPGAAWKAILPAGVRPSPYQEAIFEQVLHGQGDLIVRAVAGAGKTWTITQAARLLYLTPRANFRLALASFNVHIRKTLADRLSSTDAIVNTIHGIGYSCLKKTYGARIGRAQLDKYSWLTRDAWKNSGQPLTPSSTETIYALEQAVNLARLSLLNMSDLNAIDQLNRHYGLDLPDAAYPLIAPIVERGMQLLVDKGLHDFTDMLYAPNRLDLQPHPSDYLFIDECQDLSPAQLALILRCRKENGRLIFVGDPDQSIQGFAGSDVNAYWNIKEQTEATELPLSICYRCPSSHLELARKLVHDIQPRPDAPLGRLELLPEIELPTLVQPGDLIIGLLTAPLVKWCIRLIGLKMNARIRGLELGQELVQLLQRISRRDDFDFYQLEESIDRYQFDQTTYYSSRKRGKELLELNNDKCQALLTCQEAYQSDSLESLSQAISSLFSDEQPAVWLSTIHRAKGLENPTVFILEPHKIPLRWDDQQDWEWKQELNLRYVAVTRSQDRLVLLQPAGLTVDWRDNYIDSQLTGAH